MLHRLLPKYRATWVQWHLSLAQKILTASMLCWALASDQELFQLTSHHALCHIWRVYWLRCWTQLPTQSGSMHLDSIASFIKQKGLLMRLILTKLAQCGNHSTSSMRLQLALVTERWLYCDDMSGRNKLMLNSVLSGLHCPWHTCWFQVSLHCTAGYAVNTLSI